MNRRMIMMFSLVFLSLNTFAAGKTPSWKKVPGTYAVIKTSLGTIVCQLYDKEAPRTVENFTGLAEGTREFINPTTGKTAKRRFYDGLIFHRVIPQFMIQGGCPLGTGTGGPGYRFDDEIVPSLTFDQPGRLAMANSGPNTNGSQFFITEVATPWLNGHYNIFGQVIKGQDIVNKIALVERRPGDKPVTKVIIKKISITRVAPAPATPAVSVSTSTPVHVSTQTQTDAIK